MSMNASTSNGWGHASSTAGPSYLHAGSHAPPSSFGGSMASSANMSRMGASVISRDDMLNRLVLDQASVDCQDYGIMDLEQVAEAQRELKHITRKVIGLRTKLKVETKIRDAAIALRKAHRKTSQYSDSSSLAANSLPPPSPSSTTPDRSSLSPTSLPSRNRAPSMSSNEAKVEQDVSIATAKVDCVVGEIFKLTERASELRRSILEHQAATLSQRVTHLEFDRQIVDEKQVPFLMSSSSFDSLAPSASISAVGVTTPHYVDDSYPARIAADMTFRQNHIDLDRSVGFKFPDVPNKLQLHTEELEQKAILIKALQAELAAMRSEAEQRQTTTDKLSWQLEQEQQSRARAEQELRASHQRSAESNHSTKALQDMAVQEAVVEAERRAEALVVEHQMRAEAAEKALIESKSQTVANERALNDHRTRLDEAERRAQSLAHKTEVAERALADRARDTLELENESIKQLTIESQGHTAKIETLLRDLDLARSAQRAAETSAVESRSELDGQRQTTQHLQSRLDAQTSARSDLESRLKEAQQQTEAVKAQTAQARSNFRELELAVGAERKIMAERDELFHAFERRLESAEMRLQEQDKRCARMLGKLDGREEMDDLLERIKAGAAGVSKKQKTAGQDIAALLSSLETHISDLELELARAVQTTMLDQESSSPDTHKMQLELASKEEQIHGLKADLERTQHDLRDKLDQAIKDKDSNANKEIRDAAEKIREEERTKAETALAEERERTAQQLAQERLRLEQTLKEEREKIKAMASPPRSRLGPSEEDLAKLQRLEAEVDRLTRRNTSLEEQLQTSVTSSPATTGMNLRAMNSLGKGTNNKGVGNLIDKFGGGRRMGADARIEDHTPAIQACIKTVEGLRSMLPNLSAAAAGSADLQAIRTAFHQASESSIAKPLSPTKRSNRQSAISNASDLQVELDSITTKMKGILEVSRAVIELALGADPATRESTEVEEKLRKEHAASIADMKARLTSLTAKLHSQKDKEKKLVQTLAETKQELFDAKQLREKPASAPLSPIGLEPGAGSTVGSATPGGKATPPMSRTTSQTQLNARSQLRITPSSSSSTLAPPRSPMGMEPMPSPTRSTYGALSSPSIRYISPYAPSGLDTRTPSGKLADASDSQSIASSSPSSTTLGMPSPANSVLGLSRLQFDPLPPLPTGTVKRTMTLGMDVPQLVSRVRELERLLSQTVSMRQKADKVSELEAQLREANQAYSALVHRMEEERSTDTRQKVGLLNELNDAHSQLQTTKAHIQRVQQVSPLPTHSPLPPPKD